MPMAQGFWARSPRIHRHPAPLEKYLFTRVRKSPPLPDSQSFVEQALTPESPGIRDTHPSTSIPVEGSGGEQRRGMGAGRKAGIIMRSTLQHAASDSYYGQWPLAFPKE